MTQQAVQSAPEPATATSASSALWAGLIVAAFGIPLLWSFAGAMTDGEQRRVEAPIRALIGDEAFSRLQAGERTETHYLGDTLSAPDFTLKDRHGKPWRLSDARGKVVVMNFWTVTCQPCLEEMPSLIELAAIARNNPQLEVIAVTTDENWDAIKTIMPPEVSLKILFDPDKSVVEKKFGTRMFPETWVIDPDGVVRLRVDGPQRWSSAVAIDAIESFM